MKIYSGSSNKPLAEKIASELGISLSPLEVHVFPDGERRVRVEDTVVGEDTIVVQATGTPVDQNFMELYFIVDSLKRSGAKSITVVVPYVGYQRQDHVFRSGEAVSLEVVVQLLESVGATRAIVYDLHSIKISEAFSIPLTHLSALPLFAEKIKQLHVDSESVLVSPDMGGIRRIKIISELLGGMPFIALNKERDLASGNIVIQEFGEVDGVTHGDGGTVKKRAFIVDDMASSGKTLVEGAKLLKENGAEQVFAFVTHAIFSEDASELLQNSLIEKVFVTDSVEVPVSKQFDKLEVISVAQEIAQNLK